MTNTKNLLKGAIADAKLVRATALENAKQALTEAFTPKLQAMLSNKISEEEELEDEVPAEAAPEEAPAEEEAPVDAAPAAAAPAPEEAPAEEAPVETGEEEDLDLESIIRELDSEVTDEVPVEDAPADDQPMEAVVKEGEDNEEETDLDEVIASLSEEAELDEADAKAQDLDGTPKNESKALKASQAQLAEALKTIKILQSSLQEVNLLNAKLLYVNKLFKAANMNENQKMKIIETFDRTKTVREAKLVFSTLSEHIRSMKSTAKTPVHTVKKQIKEGAASKVIVPTKKVVVNEGFDQATVARFQKFANIKVKK